MTQALFNYHRSLDILAFMVCHNSVIFSSYADSSRFELTSPKNDDHFEVTQPLLFWHSTPGAQKYEIYIDALATAPVK